MSEDTSVTKGQLARELGVSAPYISKIVKQGKLDECFTPDGKKLYLVKSIKAYQKSLTMNKRGNDQKGKRIPPKDDTIYNQANVEELDALLEDEPAALKRVQIVNHFWAGKTKRLKFFEAEGELIPVDDAKAALDALFSPINTELGTLPILLKAHFREVPQDAVEWLSNQIDNIKRKSESKWELKATTLQDNS